MEGEELPRSGSSHLRHADGTALDTATGTRPAARDPAAPLPTTHPPRSADGECTATTAGPLWAGDGGEGAKYWLQVLTEIKNRGGQDVCMVVRDGLKGLPDATGTVWPQAVTQTRIVHLLWVSFRYAGRQDWGKISRSLKPVYTAPTAKAAEDRFLDFQEEWGGKYPAIVRLWEKAWAMNTFKQVGPRQPLQTDETPTGLCRWLFRHLHR